MATLIRINDIFDELKSENNRLLNELILSQKNTEYLSKYREFWAKITAKCVCDQSFIIEKEFNSLENSYKIFLNEGYNENNFKIKNNSLFYDNIESNIVLNDIKTEIVDNDEEFWFNNTEECMDFSDNELVSEKTKIKKKKYAENKNNIKKSAKSKVEFKIPSNKTNKEMLKEIESESSIVMCDWVGCGKLFKNKAEVKKHKNRTHISDISNKSASDIRRKRDIYEMIKSDEIHVSHETRNEEKHRVFRKPNKITGKATLFAFGCDWDWDKCQFISKDRRDVSNHYKVKHLSGKKFGKEKLVCDFPGCNYRATQSSTLLVHVKRHTGKRDYMCDWPACDQSFYTSSEVRKHMKIHSECRPFVCDWPGCEASFKRSQNLKIHYRDHTGEHPFVCKWPECTKSYKTSCSLKIHESIHTGEKNHECHECGKRFNRSFSLKLHLEVHEKNRSKMNQIIQIN